MQGGSSSRAARMRLWLCALAARGRAGDPGPAAPEPAAGALEPEVEEVLIGVNFASGGGRWPFRYRK